MRFFTSLILFAFLIASSWAHTKEFTLVISQALMRVDGVLKEVLTVNGTIPGPELRVNKGDTVIVNVQNHIKTADTAIHWHGIHQRGTPYMDGTAFVTQCPITSGSTFRYEFTVFQVGTYWYHAHHASQYLDGLYGPFIIEETVNPYASEYTEELNFLIGDWFHETSHRLQAELEAGYSNIPGLPKFLRPDSLVINGQGVYNCQQTSLNCEQKSWPVFNVTAGTTYRLRLINVGAVSDFSFSIDGHDLTIIEIDGTLVQKRVVKKIFFAAFPIGSRISVLFTANQETGNYWINVENNLGFAGLPAASSTKGILRYQGAEEIEPITLNPPGPEDTLFSELSLVNLKTNDYPYSKTLPEANYDVEVVSVLDLEKFAFFENGIKWSFPNYPLIFHKDSSQYPPTAPYIDIPNGKVVDITFINIGRLPHPVHFHGHQFWVLGVGAGSYNSSIPLNLETPILKDVIEVPTDGTGGWAKLRFVADNPGPWLLHCHIQLDLLIGFAIVLNVGQDQAPELPQGFPICGSFPGDNLQTFLPETNTPEIPHQGGTQINFNFAGLIPKK